MSKRRLVLVAAVLAAAGVLALTLTHAMAKSDAAIPAWLSAQAAWEVQHNTDSSSSAPQVQPSGQWALVSQDAASKVMGYPPPSSPSATVYLVVLHGSFVANNGLAPNATRRNFTAIPSCSQWIRPLILSTIGKSPKSVDVSSVSGLSPSRRRPTCEVGRSALTLPRSFTVALTVLSVVLSLAACGGGSRSASPAPTLHSGVQGRTMITGGPKGPRPDPGTLVTVIEAGPNSRIVPRSPPTPQVSSGSICRPATTCLSTTQIRHNPRRRRRPHRRECQCRFGLRRRSSPSSRVPMPRRLCSFKS